jgi:hypothetical protein
MVVIAAVGLMVLVAIGGIWLNATFTVQRNPWLAVGVAAAVALIFMAIVISAYLILSRSSIFSLVKSFGTERARFDMGLGEQTREDITLSGVHLTVSNLGALIEEIQRRGIDPADAGAVDGLVEQLRKRTRAAEGIEPEWLRITPKIGVFGDSDMVTVGGRDLHSPAPADVFLSASAPRSAVPGSMFVVRLAAYVEARREPTLALLRQLSPASETYVNLRQCRWAYGARVRVRLTVAGLPSATAEDEFVWRNTSNILDFAVEVPEIDAPGTLVPRLELFVEGVRVANLLLTVEVSPVPSADARVTVTQTPARTAFASYARRDRKRVLDRVASLRIAAGLEIWLDHFSLIPNQRWKEKIEQKIGETDLFLLFWSPNASRSKWVTWEWKLAWAKKPRDRFQIHPLQYAPPPPELADLQVDDVLMTLRSAPAVS